MTLPSLLEQMVHISNGREAFSDRNHSDLITVMPSSYRNAPWIEIEAKHKEEAIAKLRQEWLPTLEPEQGWVRPTSEHRRRERLPTTSTDSDGKLHNAHTGFEQSTKYFALCLRLHVCGH